MGLNSRVRDRNVAGRSPAELTFAATRSAAFANAAPFELLILPMFRSGADLLYAAGD
jgi:hypothetical protein